MSFSIFNYLHGENLMAENTEETLGLSITIGLDTDDENRIWTEDYMLDPPDACLWLTVRNISGDPIRLNLPSQARGCFVILGDENRRLWTYPGHPPRIKTELRLDPGATYEERIEGPWGQVHIQPGVQYILAGWINGHPHLSASLRFSLALKES